MKREIENREAPWSSGERRGLTVWAMVLGCEFDSRVHLKTRWIRRTTWWQKNENNKDSQKGQVTPKTYLKRERERIAKKKTDREKDGELQREKKWDSEMTVTKRKTYRDTTEVHKMAERKNGCKARAQQFCSIRPCWGVVRK
jgi:hypothetical protein